MAASEDVRIIDCDAHWTEPEDLWTAQVPASIRDRVPVQKTIDGKTAWYLYDELWASTGGNTITDDGEKALGTHSVQPFPRVHQSSWAVKERLELCDRIGVFAQILYPNGIGFASNHLFAIENEEDRTNILRLYNDHLADVQEESNGRLFPQAVLPVWDMDLTIKEMARMLDRGIRGFTLSDKPELLGLPELPESYFDPMWDLFNESRSVVNFHIGSGARREDMEALRASTGVQSGFQANEVEAKRTKPDTLAPMWRSLSTQRKLAVLASQLYMSNVRIIANLCMSNLFDRYQNLKIVSAESGIGWVPFMLEALEYQFDEMVTTDQDLGMAKRRPKDYFRDHLYVMFWFEQIAAEKLIEDIGVNNVLIETDVPHPTCLYPNPREHFDRVLRNLSAHDRKRVMQDNAAEIYRIEVPTA